MRKNQSFCSLCKQNLLTFGLVILFFSLGDGEVFQPKLNVIERGFHHKTVQYETTFTNAFGVVKTSYHKYAILENGLHRFENGKWIETEEKIKITPDGALASDTVFKVKFSANLNTWGGTEVLTADNKRLRFHVLGLGYISAASGKSVVFAKVKDCRGLLLPPNRILYQDAFDGEGVKASVIYTVRKGGLSQDVIIEQVPNPEDCGFIGEAAEDIRLEVITEFTESSDVKKKVRVIPAVFDMQKRQRMRIPDFTDDELDFGSMQMARGIAYPLIKGEKEEMEIPVYKSWFKETESGRQFLIESMEWEKVKEQIKLSAEKPVGLKVSFPKDGEIVRNFPHAPAGSDNFYKGIMVASVLPQLNGLCADFELILGATNFVFQGDTTYFIPSTVYLYGSTIFEGGAVIKYGTNLNTHLKIYGPIECKTEPYNPVYFTTMNDDSVGEIVSGSTGNPMLLLNYTRALELNDATTAYILKHLNIRYLYRVFALYGSIALTLKDSSVGDAYYCISLSGNTNLIKLQNCLVYRMSYAIQNHRTNLIGENVTFDSINYLLTGDGEARLTNCLLVAVTNGLNYTGSNNAVENSPSVVFQKIGAGEHYLAENSPYRGAGTTNIEPSLLAELRQRTTKPPIIISNQLITTNTALESRGLNDNSSGIDLGYHYSILDYIVDNMVVSNATLYLMKGVVVGVSYGGGSNCGIWVENYGNLISAGMPSNPNRVVRLASVQEMVTPPGYNYPTLGTKEYRSFTGDINLRFTKFNLIAGPYCHIKEDHWWCGSDNSNWYIRDCEFYGGKIILKPNNVNRYFTWFNNLFNKVNIVMLPYAGIQWTVHNNLFYKGYFGLEFYPGISCDWLVFNNLFDQTSIYVDSRITNLYHYYNGYVDGYSRLPGQGWSDVILVQPPVYQEGPLGKFYYPTNIPLIDAGCDPALEWGVYHYTTINTHGEKEGDTIVDIGYHYVACETDGRLIDTDGDGLEDWYEDTNGNGIYDSGDVSSFNTYDTDDDGYSDLYEVMVSHTNPLSWDTDSDGMSDAWEILHDTNPNDPNDALTDVDNDGISNINEYRYELRLLKPREPIGPCSRRTPLVISEIMYHPANGGFEYIELYNSHHLPQKLDGFIICNKDKDKIFYTFPAGTTINPNSYIVIIPAIELPNGGETIQLRNNLGAVLLEIEYSDMPPWPKEADGAGHSLVLARPSYGEGDPRAWAASAKIGGSPGMAEPEVFISALDYIKINEFLAKGSSPDFIELFNICNKPINISGCYLSKESTNICDFRIQANTTIPGRGCIVLYRNAQNSFTFGLKDEDGEIFLTNPNKTQVIDAIRYERQSYNVTSGRYPDGTENIVALSMLTPGSTNSTPIVSNIVINEIMYNPIWGDNFSKYVELYNSSTNAVNISGWEFKGGIEYKFPNGTFIGPTNYIVVSDNVSMMITNYPNLVIGFNLFGNYYKQLSRKSDKIILTDATGVIIDEVTYYDGGQWGKWSDGGGSSLELIDAHSDNRYGDNWGDSNETDKSEWTLVEYTGYLDNGTTNSHFPDIPTNYTIWSNTPAPLTNISLYPDAIEISLDGAGECLVDNVEVIVNGTNYIHNSTFENGLEGWLCQGNHCRSFLASIGHNSEKCLHIVARGRGDTGANRIRGAFTTTNLLLHGNVATIKANVRWLCGSPRILFRIRGNFLDYQYKMNIPDKIGTPGFPNSIASTNLGPSISDVWHFPVLPQKYEPILVSAKINDPDGIASVILYYRIDPNTNYAALAMNDDGLYGDSFAHDGIYTCKIPGQNTNLIAFYINSIDSKNAQNRYPKNPPDYECLIRTGESSPPGDFGVYRIWLTQNNSNIWLLRPVESDEPVDITFVYGSHRIIYNASAWFSGSPYTRITVYGGYYYGPSTRICSYSLSFPKDERFLGADEAVLDWPIWAEHAQNEQVAFWIANELGLPSIYRRFVHLYVNGRHMANRGLQNGMGAKVYEDTQKPDSDYIDQWFPDENKGYLYKFDSWYEFEQQYILWIGGGNPTTGLILTTNYVTGQPEKKSSYYRVHYREQSNKLKNDNYLRFYNLIDCLNTNAENYTEIISSVIDVDQWMRVFAMEDIVLNSDSFGNGNSGKNMYAYLPNKKNKWQLIPFDLDLALGAHPNNYPEVTYSSQSSLFNCSDTNISRLNLHPPFLRAYWRVIEEAVNGPMHPERIGPIFDMNYIALLINGIKITNDREVLSPDQKNKCSWTLREWIERRRVSLSNELSKLSVPFEITNNGGNNFVSTNQNIILTGTAPIDVKSIKINNGTEYAPIYWTSVTNWSVSYNLNVGTNHIDVYGFGKTNYFDSIEIIYQP